MTEGTALVVRRTIFSLLALSWTVLGSARAGGPEPAFDEVLGRLRARPGPSFAADLALAEKLGRARAERDLIERGADASRETLRELARATDGSSLGLAFERAERDLALSGRRVPIEPPPAVVLYFAGWAPCGELAAVAGLARAHPGVAMQAVALDEHGDAAERAFAKVSAPANLTLRHDREPWTSAECRALGLAERGVPLVVLLDPAGRVVRAGASLDALETWLGRARP